MLPVVGGVRVYSNKSWWRYQSKPGNIHRLSLNIIVGVNMLFIRHEKDITELHKLNYYKVLFYTNNGFSNGGLSTRKEIIQGIQGSVGGIT